MGEDAVLHAGQEHDRELQALRGVEGHECDDAVALLGQRVGVGHEGDTLEERVEGPGRERWGVVRVGRLDGVDRWRVVVDRGGSRDELAGDRDELGEVLDPGLVLRVVAGLERREVAGAGERGLEHLVGRRPIGRHRAQVVHDRLELPHRVGRPRGELVDLVDPAHRVGEADALAGGEHLERRLRPFADAPLGLVDDAAQRDDVALVGDGPQVGQCVADLLALVEAHAADDLVRQADADEHLLEHAALGVGAVEHRDPGRRDGGVVGELVDLVGDELRLVALVVADVADDALALSRCRPQVLGRTVLVATDDRVGGREDRLGRAVVLLEHDGLGVREVLLELEDVADRGTAEGVDRLVGVAHDHEVGVLVAELTDELVLRVVGVLVLVDEHVAEPAPVVLGDLRVPVQECDGLTDQVIEVESVGRA